VMTRSANGTATGNGAGVYVIGGSISKCVTCLSSNFDCTLAAQLYQQVVGSTTGVIQPFTAIHNPYTLDYSTSPGSFAVPSARLTLLTTTNIYVKYSAGSGRSTQMVVMTYKANAVPASAAEYNNATLTRYPTGSPQAGSSYDTGAIPLGAGVWYITPYCYTTVSSSVNCGFDFAVGIGSEPAAAAGLTAPLAMITALIAGLAALMA